MTLMSEQELRAKLARINEQLTLWDSLPPKDYLEEERDEVRFLLGES